MSAKIKETVKETVAEEVNRVKEASNEAIQSGAYLYPVKVRLMYLFLFE